MSLIGKNKNDTHNAFDTFNTSEMFRW